VIPVFDVLHFLRAIQNPGTKLLFYPSAGQMDSWIFDLGYHINVLCDFAPNSHTERTRFFRNFIRNSSRDIHLVAATKQLRVFSIDESRWGIYLFAENNRVFDEIIRRSGLDISCFVGICDGCGEGGNHECVNSAPFFSKVLSLMPQERAMHVITDHSPYLFSGGWDDPILYQNDLEISGFAYRVEQVIHTKRRSRRVKEFMIRHNYMTDLGRLCEDPIWTDDTIQKAFFKALGADVDTIQEN
jgi:hypothetical protein